MKTYTIKITGSGTTEEIYNALTQLRWDINDMERKGQTTRTVEDYTLLAEIQEGGEG